MPAVAVNLVYWSICLVRRRAWPVFWVNVVTSVAMFVGVLMLSSDASITSVGVLHFVVQTVIAGVVLVPTVQGLRDVRRGRVNA
jgi:hypothetical protein